MSVLKQNLENVQSLPLFTHIYPKFLQLQYKGTSTESSTRVHFEVTLGAPRSLMLLNEFFLVLRRLRCALLVNLT